MSFLRQGMIYIVGEVGSKLLPFLMLPYLTREMGTKGFGLLSYYLVIYTFSLIFISLSQDGALGRYFYRYGTKGLASLLMAGWCLALVSTTLIVICLIAAGKTVFIPAVLLAFTQTVVLSLLSLKQCQKEALAYIKIQFFISLSVSILTIIVFENIEASAESRINTMLFSNIIGITFTLYFFNKSLDLFALSYSRFKLHFKYILAFGVPLVVHQLSFFGKGQFDRFLISHAFSIEELGIYSAAFQVASILTVLLYALNKAIVPILYLKLKERLLDKNDILKLTKMSFLLVPLPSLLSFLVPNEFYLFLLGSDFNGAKYYVVIFLLGLALHFPYQIMVNFLFYHGKNKQIAFATFGSLIVHVTFIIWCSFEKALQLIPYAIFISNAYVLAVLYLQVSSFSKKTKMEDV